MDLLRYFKLVDATPAAPASALPTQQPTASSKGSLVLRPFGEWQQRGIAIPLPAGLSVTVGRNTHGIDDRHISRRHMTVLADANGRACRITSVRHPPQRPAHRGRWMPAPAPRIADPGSPTRPARAL